MAALGESLYGAVVFGSNIGSSVTLVLANKVLMQGNLAFKFPATLSGFHFLTTATFLRAAQQFGWFGMKPPVPREKSKDSDQAGLAFAMQIAWFVFLSMTSLVSMNFSLLYNSVGMYQIAKLLIFPVTALIEFLFYGKRFSYVSMLAGAIVMAGVAIVTVTDVYMTPMGLFFAASSVLSTSLQQILIGSYQREHKLSSSEFLALIAPYQMVGLLTLGPFMDKYGGNGAWIFDFHWTFGVVALAVLTCVLALGVNISQYATLGLFTATTYQVVGHIKTVLLLVSAALFLGEAISGKKAMGMTVAVAGIVLYGYSSSAPVKVPEPITVKNIKDIKGSWADETTPLKDGSPHSTRV